ncbi:MAG: ferrous iron transport protein B [Nitrososphaeria archaeon]|nr:ferrous iron transport protein B [Nitrososphaeria archaeon]
MKMNVMAYNSGKGKENGHSKGYDFLIALAAQPNAGKTTLFNTLTGKTGYVGNWPGKTVERMEGTFVHHGKIFHVIDLPGIYSLSALTLEEFVSREFIVDEQPHAVVVLLDAEALERSFYFLLQILELMGKVVVAINKYDVAQSKGLHINTELLENELGVPVVTISAIKKTGLGELLDRIVDVAEGRLGRQKEFKIEYGPLEHYINRIESVLAEYKLFEKYPRRWVALRIIEGDIYFIKEIEEKNREAAEAIVEIVKEIKNVYKKDPVELIILYRYEFLNELISKTTEMVRISEKRLIEKLDNILLNPYSGPILSSLILLSMIFLAFIINTGFPLNYIFISLGYESIAEYIEENSLSALISKIFSVIAEYFRDFAATYNIQGWPLDLVIEGIIPGVGSVLTFLPLIFIVNVLMALLEDSGLMSRIAVSFDRLLKKVGLTGKTIFPLTLSLGCNVPGIMGTRILETDEERLSAIILMPLIICQARLFVLLIMVSALFTGAIIQTFVTASIYIISLMLFLLFNKIVSKKVFKQKEEPELIIELSSYHLPSLRVIRWISWERSKSYIIKAGTLIFLFSIILWVLSYFGPSVTQNVNESYGAIIAKTFTPALSMIGIDDWIIPFALMFGWVAKEIFITAIVVATGKINPIEAVASLSLTPLQSYALLILVMFYSPCLAAFVTVFNETRSFRLTLFSAIVSLLIGFTGSISVYWIGRILGYN